MSVDHKTNPALLKDIESGTNLKHAATQEKNPLPSVEDISQEKTVQAIPNFDSSQLKHVEPQEKTGWKESISHDKATEELGKFDKSQLKHTETSEKNPLPDQDAIVQEKKEVQLRDSIGKHDRSSLRKVETNERDALKEIVAQEATHKGIESFSKDNLKHAETVEKNPLPTADDIKKEKTTS
ncbi:thymosin beta-like isoform X3 [Mya arenaria]|uniref:thymosin beta-like isoform X3 n=1 Tax=Mya arenaria TaxID=6604 RepID=UPI0022E31736|nr:thymosin beta-like isoform X3 [Mya arenaria]